MDTPLKARGEAEIKIGSRMVRVKSSYSSLCAIEEALGHSVLLLASRGQEKDIKVRDIAILLSCMAQAAGEKLSEQEAGDLLVENGYLTPLPALMTVFTSALKAGSDEQQDVPPKAEGGVVPPP